MYASFLRMSQLFVKTHRGWRVNRNKKEREDRIWFIRTTEEHFTLM